MKCLVKAHGGSLAVKSDFGEDGSALTNFSFTLPMWARDGFEASKRSAAAAGPRVAAGPAGAE